MDNMQDYPYAEVFVEFYSPETGGRLFPVNLNDNGYSPHLRIKNEKEYLGVEFVEGTDYAILPGRSANATVRFLYWPKVNYDRLEVGVEFEILEGPTVVGKGKIIRK